jgi:hypothetical protein
MGEIYIKFVNPLGFTAFLSSLNILIGVGDLARLFIRVSIIRVSEFGGRLEANSICVSKIRGQQRG